MSRAARLLAAFVPLIVAGLSLYLLLTPNSSPRSGAFVRLDPATGRVISSW